MTALEQLVRAWARATPATRRAFVRMLLAPMRARLAAEEHHAAKGHRRAARVEAPDRGAKA